MSTQHERLQASPLVLEERRWQGFRAQLSQRRGTNAVPSSATYQSTSNYVFRHVLSTSSMGWLDGK